MQKSPSVLNLDSRSRMDQGDPNTCIFHLQDALNSTKFELTNFTFANILHNVTTTSNTLFVSGVLRVTIQPGLWLAPDFVNDPGAVGDGFWCWHVCLAKLGDQRADVDLGRWKGDYRVSDELYPWYQHGSYLDQLHVHDVPCWTDVLGVV